MGVATICSIGFVTAPLLVYLMACGYVWLAGTAQLATGEGVYLHAKAVPYVAWVWLTRVRALPLVLAADASNQNAWISPPYGSIGQMAASRHLYDLPSWTWYARGFGR